MQGRGAVQIAPAPWVARNGDPDFSWCNGGDAFCRSSVGVNVNNAQSIYLYSSCGWAFFDGPWNGELTGELQWHVLTIVRRLLPSESVRRRLPAKHESRRGLQQPLLVWG